jgi:predicted metal-dependent phosphoesterase TrpH
MVKSFRADLHVHTCLSPCADLTMSPKRILEKAMEKGIDILGICDHNSAENVQAAMYAGEKAGIAVLPGIEVTSSEEVHLLAYFDEIELLLELQRTVYDHLTPGENDDNVFGEQIVANENDEVEGFNKRLLIGSTSLSTESLAEKIRRLGGLVIAAHVDRETFSIISQLAFIPEDINLDAVEISSCCTVDRARERFPQLINYPIISSSDAHFLNDIGKAVTLFMLEEPTVSELKKALANKDYKVVYAEMKE